MLFGSLEADNTMTSIDETNNTLVKRKKWKNLKNKNDNNNNNNNNINNNKK